MKIGNDKPVAGMDRGATPTPGSDDIAPNRPDRVSLGQSQQASELVSTARSEAASSRATRMRAIEQAVRSGSYKPNPSHVADEILAAAELEVRLRSMVG